MDQKTNGPPSVGKSLGSLRLDETILSTTDDFAYVFDPEGRFLYANPGLLKVWARTLEEIVGKTCHDLGYPTWHADMHLREIQEIVRTKKPIRGEVPFKGDSGISGIYDYIFKPVLDAAGNVEVIVGTTRDVTARHQARGCRWFYRSFHPFPLKICRTHFSTLASRVLDCLGAEK